ncbi:hypothetical protein M902_0242 [Bacteriovorax sp. BAL6_X]|uniref:hypothetical protein n=1 Tax=Bacteriovorax sp. BAL6_X TaxID=1201290 RepID=UPI000385B430|nr:hypothetical protein [Bacteriovorax sp. BAL6_X]EPZ49421.1 hypothetical protein M902_0242 [Bacteriovorax sp. BAL6_X]
MIYLFIDTSHLLHFGILDENFSWIEDVVVETKKTSEVLHENIHSLLSKHGLDVSHIKGLISIAGPGSYTGMRVGEGFAQVFELDDIEVFSFYSSDIPSILGQDSTHWMFPAFKKEYYIRTNEEEKLLSQTEFDAFYSGIVDKSQLYTHGVNELSAYCEGDTRDVLRKNPGPVFRKVVSERMRQRPYYFRPLHVEFKKS